MLDESVGSDQMVHYFDGHLEVSDPPSNKRTSKVPSLPFANNLFYFIRRSERAMSLNRVAARLDIRGLNEVSISIPFNEESTAVNLSIFTF